MIYLNADRKQNELQDEKFGVTLKRYVRQ